MVWKGPPPEDFAKNPKLLLELARQAGADTVIVDSLKDVALDIAKDEGGAGYNRARQIALAAGIEILEIHHQRKSQSDNRKPRKLDDVYGSNFLTAGAGSVLLLWGQPGDRLVEMFHLKQPAEEIGKMQLLHDAETGSISVQQQLDPLSLVNSQPGITAADAARLLYEIEGQIEAKETEKARSRLAALVKRGLIREERGSRGGRTPNPTTYHPIINREEP